MSEREVIIEIGVVVYSDNERSNNVSMKGRMKLEKETRCFLVNR